MVAVGVASNVLSRLVSTCPAPSCLSLPSESDLRYHWAHVRPAAIDAHEMRDLVEDAWALIVPNRVAEAYAASRDY